MAELRGMSAAARVPLEVLLSLYALQETLVFARRAGVDDGCTSLVCPPTGTANGWVLLAHNEDAGPSRHLQASVLRARPRGEPAFVAFADLGLLVYQGFNAPGLPRRAMRSRRRICSRASPSCLPIARCSARTLQCAIRATTRPEWAHGNTHLIATVEGRIGDVEVTGSRYALHPAGNRPLAQTNYGLVPALREVERRKTLDSHLRSKRVDQLLRERCGHLTMSALQAIVRDHANWPHTVCAHEDRAGNELRGRSRASSSI
jgi:isopenicillin-N N-acyltransferase-like protein